MTAQVTGVLIDPIGGLARGVVIRIISTVNSGDTLFASPATITTDKVTGEYDFTLENGTVTIEAVFSATYKLAGTVTITDGMPATTLPELLTE